MSLYTIESKGREELEAMYSEMITKAFTTDVQSISSHKLIHVPYVRHQAGGNIKVSTQPLQDAVFDEICTDEAFKLVMQILAKSPCAMVQQLRELLAKQYADNWVTELAEVSL